MGDLSKNFSKREFVCRCGCGRFNLSPVLLDALQRFRDYLGVPLHVNSGCRCEKHNAAEGGDKNSMHLYGKAADIWADDISAQDLARLAEVIPEFSNGGIGRYATFIHVDVRGRKARWRG